MESKTDVPLVIMSTFIGYASLMIVLMLSVMGRELVMAVWG